MNYVKLWLSGLDFDLCNNTEHFVNKLEFLQIVSVDHAVAFATLVGVTWFIASRRITSDGPPLLLRS